MADFVDVKEVRITNDDQGYDGQLAQIILAEEHKFGVDLRVKTKDGNEFWISSDNVVGINKVM